MAEPGAGIRLFARDPLLMHSLVEPHPHQYSLVTAETLAPLAWEVWTAVWPGASVAEIALYLGRPVGAVLVGLHELLGHRSCGDDELVRLLPTVAPLDPAAPAVLRRLAHLTSPPIELGTITRTIRSAKVVVAGGPTADKARLLATLTGQPGARLPVSLPLPQQGATTESAVSFVRCATAPDEAVLAFATPAEADGERFMWHDLVRGALGAIVAVDARRPQEALPALAACRRRGVVHVLAVTSPSLNAATSARLRADLALSTDTPVVAADPGDHATPLRVVETLAEAARQRWEHEHAED
ncbi:hypothetical protein [Salinactinospora qingdaonensis]|uniref:hypothetical protein n=1 Tax=Salinactinospora qingdaonensis TaxID=702744 RepID=UPI0031EE6FCA